MTEIDGTFEKQIEVEKRFSREEGREEGFAEGKTEGLVKGKAESVIMLLDLKGTVPSELKERIISIRDVDTLDRLFKIAATTDSLKKFVEKM